MVCTQYEWDNLINLINNPIVIVPEIESTGDVLYDEAYTEVLLPKI